jgi:hypothetical protein
VNHHEAVKRQHLEAIDDGLLADAGQPLDAVERRLHLAVFEGEVQKGPENPRHGPRDALLALVAAALDHVEGAQDARVGVAVDAKPRGGVEGALGAVVDVMQQAYVRSRTSGKFMRDNWLSNRVFKSYTETFRIRTLAGTEHASLACEAATFLVAPVLPAKGNFTKIGPVSKTLPARTQLPGNSSSWPEGPP